MKKKLRLIPLFVCALLQFIFSFSQSDTTNKRHHIAIFSPLYLDSAFDAAGNYRFGKNFPRFINPGLEFYAGAQMAIDSLEKEGAPLDVHVYDTRSKKDKIEQILKTNEFAEIDLIIGHVSANEIKLLADAAAKKNVPFINVNYPNDAGITNNPNFVILNSTLYTHCSGIYKFLQRNFALSPIVFFRKKGPQEDRLQSYFTEIAKLTSSVPLKIKYVTLDDNFTSAQLKKHLDSNNITVSIAGSLDLNFAHRISEQLAYLNMDYPTTLFGMPTWDAADFTKPQYNQLEIYISTPFYSAPTDQLVQAVHNQFKSKFYSRPSDLVYRGFETFYHFAHLLMIHGKNIGSSLSDRKYKLFTEFDIQPVINKQTMTLDYFENKKIYFVKKIDGVIRAVY